ncbi:MAG: hypothetical protein J5548_09850 [Prevotella sp.]|nr:hypothetical protein [Prevotella sp.]
MRKNIIFLVVALLGIASFSKAENVSIDDFTIKQGDIVQVPLKLTNTNTNLTAFSMTLTLPNGLKLLGGESTSRFAGTIEVGSPDTNVYNVCGIDLASGVISGTSGDLVILTFEASQDFKGGYATITEVDFITNDRRHVRCADSSFKVDYEPSGNLFIGDVDNNGIVDISDVMSAVNKMLGKNVSPFNFANADTDGSGEIDIVDVMNIVNIMLGKKSS